jgi:hypothetical protein
MNPTIRENPISAFLGLGLLDARLSLIETVIAGTRNVCVGGLATGNLLEITGFSPYS